MLVSTLYEDMAYYFHQTYWNVLRIGCLPNLCIVTLFPFHSHRGQFSVYQFRHLTMLLVFPSGQPPYCNFEVFHSSVSKQDFVRMTGIEPAHLAALDPKSSVSTSSTTSACLRYQIKATLKSTYS